MVMFTWLRGNVILYTVSVCDIVEKDYRSHSVIQKLIIYTALVW